MPVSDATLFLNIWESLFLSDRCNKTIDLVLVDGNKSPESENNIKTIIKGDSTSASIAAASILAKVSRDRYMMQMAEKYPQYQFEKHKGYGTKLHTEKILEFGPSEIHRRSFLKKLYIKNDGCK